MTEVASSRNYRRGTTSSDSQQTSADRPALVSDLSELPFSSPTPMSAPTHNDTVPAPTAPSGYVHKDGFSLFSFLKKTPEKVSYSGNSTGFAPIAEDSKSGFMNNLAQSLGFAVTTDATAALSRPVHSNDIWSRERAERVIKTFLQPFDSDKLRLEGFVQIMRHYALNSTSTRTPEEVVYDIGGRNLSMRDFSSYLGDSLRRCMRAFADDVAMLTRTDEILQSAMQRRYGVPISDLPYVFDFADACTNMSQHARNMVMKYKRDILRRAAIFDARGYAAIEAEDAQARGAPASTTISI